MSDGAPLADAAQAAVIEAKILDLTAARGPNKSICPSEAARAAAAALWPRGDAGERWRTLGALTQTVARRLARQGVIELRQRGAVVEPEAARGAVRLAQPRRQRLDRAADRRGADNETG